MDEEITIRKAETPADYRACQDAQRSAWGIRDDSYIVPIATLVGAQRHGGLVLGAFLTDGRAVGLSFGFLGKTGGRLCLYSQLTGIAPGYQDRGIGGRLKTAQREFARNEGLPCIAWAFDPLQAGNARFNLDKLGATAGRYIVDMYGIRNDALNVGATTDRLIVEWETAESPRAAIDVAALLKLPRLVEAADGPAAIYDRSAAHASASLLEIPADIAALRTRSPQAAHDWGQAVREAFLSAFDAGFRGEGFIRSETLGDRRCFYVLKRSRIDRGRAES
jgi:predicted GNAT superfamily acetyltransferase